MLSLVALIPGFGPFLAATLGGAGALFKSAWSAISPVLSNPFVQGAICAVVLFLGWNWQEARYTKAVAAGQAAVAVEHGAFVQEKASFGVVLTALNGQSAAVRALAAAGSAKTAASAKIAEAAPAAMAKAQAEAVAIAASSQGVTGCSAAMDTYQASRKALQ